MQPIYGSNATVVPLMSNPYATQQRSQLQNAAPQSAEGWALVETARRLEAAKQNPQDLDAILMAVRTNWRIWTIIQSSLVDPECPLPREIRENLVNLSRFIDRRSAELIASPKDVHKLDVLINIDRQIGAGLLGNPAEDDEAPPRPGQPPRSSRHRRPRRRNRRRRRRPPGPCRAVPQPRPRLSPRPWKGPQT